MTAAAFSGNYADIVTRKTRSVFVVSVEFPIEQYQAFVAAFGGPLPGKEIPVAIARLHPDKPASEPRKGNGEALAKERRRFSEPPLPQQAALRCDDADFCRFVTEEHDGLYGGVDAAERVRAYCGVTSRSEIKPGTQAARRWQELDRAFLDWKHQIPLAESAR